MTWQGAVANKRSTRDMCTKEGMPFGMWCDIYGVHDPDQVLLYMPEECRQQHLFGGEMHSCAPAPASSSPPPTTTTTSWSLADDDGGYVMNLADEWF